MANIDIIKNIERIKELEEFIDELKAECEATKDTIKAEMNRLDVDTLEAGQYVVKYTDTLTQRFDTKRFKDTMGSEMYKLFTKEVSSKRFSIA